ncbi:TPA: hypothetical protein ACH3X2_003093 [Trebouxia sp. C0005]
MYSAMRLVDLHKGLNTLLITELSSQHLLLHLVQCHNHLTLCSRTCLVLRLSVISGAAKRLCGVYKSLTMQRVVALLAVGLTLVAAQPFQPGQNLVPLGNLRTQDFGGPYNLTLLSTQEAEIKSGIAAKQNYTDADIVNFLTNVECIEGQFDTWGAFGFGFVGNLNLGGPAPIGARKANLSDAVEPYMQEIALSEQGHALFVRQAGGYLPCPLVDFTGGFNAFFGAAYGLGNSTIEEVYGSAFDPFMNDQNFVLSVLTLEEFGATGNKGLVGLLSNPVLANGVAGLATSATAFAAVERTLLYQMRNATVEPFGETVQQVFARISALRDSLDGPQSDDQGLLNSDPRNIAVPDTFINNIPTDIRGSPSPAPPSSSSTCTIWATPPLVPSSPMDLLEPSIHLLATQTWPLALKPTQLHQLMHTRSLLRLWVR